MPPLPWYIQHWPGLKDTVTAVIGLAAACSAVFTYRRNALTKRAEFLANLHKNFFVDDTYKETRDLLDDSAEEGEARREALVEKNQAAFTDFLNFFELVAYFAEMGACKRKDVEALLGYYLRLLRQSRSVYSYVCNQKNDFEHLKRLLDTLEP